MVDFLLDISRACDSLAPSAKSGPEVYLLLIHALIIFTLFVRETDAFDSRGDNGLYPMGFLSMNEREMWKGR